MIDEDFKVYLIEVNTNPCLELACSLLTRIVPNMIENVMRFLYIITGLQWTQSFHHLKRVSGMVNILICLIIFSKITILI